MAKYEIEVGSLVTVYRRRKLIIHAETEDTAIEKAIDQFWHIAEKAGWDVGGTIEVNYLLEA